MKNIEIKVDKSKDGRRIFVTAHGFVVDVCVVEDGILVNISKDLEIVASCSVDKD